MFRITPHPAGHLKLEINETFICEVMFAVITALTQRALIVGLQCHPVVTNRNYITLNFRSSYFESSHRFVHARFQLFV